MEGFFTRKEINSSIRPDGKTYTCVSCGLYQKCKTPKMQPYGRFKKKILNIGEAPGEIEDNRGKPFQGITGSLLKETYRKLGIDLFEDCLNINAVNCRPIEKGSNRTPTNYEIECCRKSIIKIIEEYKPKVIILLGFSAVYSLIGYRWKKDLGTISKWRGWTIPDQDFKCWICPTFHPSYVERSNHGVEEVIWINDLKETFACLENPFPIYKEPEIEIIQDLSILKNIKSDTIAFDYETTGLKPHYLEHKIISCAIADTPDHVYAFIMPKDSDKLDPLIDLLVDKNIKKIAQNMKYENTWSWVKLGIKVRNWFWDTMIASHILDNRSGITSLKFQTYVNLGIVDYDSEVSPYFQSIDPKNANSLNRIFDLIKKPGGISSLLKYNAYDAINEYRLAEKQRECLLPF